MSRAIYDAAEPVKTLVALSMKGLARWAKQSPKVRFNAMVKSGLIDKRGKVRNRPSARTLGELTRELERRKRKAAQAGAR